MDDAPSLRESVGPSLSDLLARVEAATGPDRELDALICAALRVLSPAAEKERWAREWKGPFVAKGELVYLAHDDGTLCLNMRAAPVTGSLDAAIALGERFGARPAFTLAHCLTPVEPNATADRIARRCVAALLKVLQALGAEGGTHDGSSPQNPPNPKASHDQ